MDNKLVKDGVMATGTSGEFFVECCREHHFNRPKCEDAEVVVIDSISTLISRKGNGLAQCTMST